MPRHRLIYFRPAAWAIAALCLVGCTLGQTPRCVAGLVEYRFGGVANDGADVYGVNILVGDVVSGRFTIDTDAPAVLVTPGEYRYTYSIPNGFEFSVNGFNFVTSQYWSTRYEDQYGLDSFVVEGLPDDFTRNGVPVTSQNDGWNTIQVAMNWPDTELTGGAIPSTTTIGNATDPYLYIADLAGGWGLSATFELEPITAVPEPTSMALVAVTGLAAGMARLRRRKRTA